MRENARKITTATRRKSRHLDAPTSLDGSVTQCVNIAGLTRVPNATSTLEREYAIGSGRMDLCLRYGSLTLGIELKVWRDGEGDPLEDGLAQLDGYLAGLGLDTGWLVIFDRRRDQPPISQRTSASAAITLTGRGVTVIRA